MTHALDLNRTGNVRRRTYRVRRISLRSAATTVMAASAMTLALTHSSGRASDTVAQRTKTASARVSFDLCHSGGGHDCVVDGDTFWMGGVKIRIADIDLPGTHPARCAHEAKLGAAATQRLRTLLNGGTVSLAAIDRNADRYGRKLRIVSIDGSDIGDTLVAEGLARRYEGGRRDGWCD